VQIRGGTGKAVGVTLETDASDFVRDEDVDKLRTNDTHAYTGRARLEVRTIEIEGCCKSRLMQSLSFPILPVRSS
jgi:hypothetical protein